VANDRVFKTEQDLIKAFVFWSAPYAHLTIKERIDGFIDTYKITPEEITALTAYLQKVPPPTPPAPPPPELPPPTPPAPKPPPPPAPRQPPPPAPPPPAKPVVKPELIIPRTPYPKWWKTLQTAAISLTAAGSQIVVPSRPGFSLFIATIVLVVSDETNISFGFGVFGSSGAMLLGGGIQPSGMVIAMGDSPAPCGKSGFTITSDGAAVTVGGFVTYYLQTET